MVERVLLDKLMRVDTLYRAEWDRYFVVDQVGTNSTTKATLKVDGAVVLEIFNKLALLNERDIERFPPFPLGSNYIVIPPRKIFEFSGSSGSMMRLKGFLYILAPGEAMAEAHNVRFSEQPKRYYVYDTATGGIGESATWADKEEHTVIDKTCDPGEEWLYDTILYCRRTGIVAGSIGFIAMRPYIDDRPLDNIDPTLGPIGVASEKGHHYADTTSYFIPVPLKEMPVKLTPGRNLKIKARNISGAEITTGAGQEAKLEIAVVRQRELV